VDAVSAETEAAAGRVEEGKTRVGQRGGAALRTRQHGDASGTVEGETEVKPAQRAVGKHGMQLV
jgi:hypothetical protein